MAALSRLLGKNPAYIHQYLNRGSPRRLGEDERRTLARFFRVDEALLGGPDRHTDGADALVPIVRRPVRAAAGSGSWNDEEAAEGRFAFDPAWLKRLTRSRPEHLSLVRVEGDSMAPTLKDGDDILVDQQDGAAALRDGIYVLRIEDRLVVKRLAVHPFDRGITIQSDNPAYPDWPGREAGEVDLVGRVLWAGRRVD